MGNLRSVQKSFEHAGVEDVVVTTIPRSSRPPTGSCYRASARFAMPRPICARGGVQDVLRRKIGLGTPFLGICLGMQLLADMGFRGRRVHGTRTRAWDVRAAARRREDPAHRVEHRRIPARVAAVEGIPESTAFLLRTQLSARSARRRRDHRIDRIRREIRCRSSGRKRVRPCSSTPRSSSSMGLQAPRQLSDALQARDEQLIVFPPSTSLTAERSVSLRATTAREPSTTRIRRPSLEFRRAGCRVGPRRRPSTERASGVPENIRIIERIRRTESVLKVEVGGGSATWTRSRGSLGGGGALRCSDEARHASGFRA